MMRSFTASTRRVGSRARRKLPYAPMTASAIRPSTGASHARRAMALSSISVAGLAKMATARNVRPHSPISEAVCASASGLDSA